MDWALAITHNHQTLVRLVAAIFAVVGIVPGGKAVSSMPKPVRMQVLRLLRPAEAALRRLIVMAAEGMKVRARVRRSGPMPKLPKAEKSDDHIPPFPLFDPRKWFPELAKSRRALRGPGPRISGFGDGSWTPHTPPPPTDFNPVRLCGRLQALHKALEEIPKQAKRLVRMQARRRATNEPLKRTEPLRSGWPPGHRKHQTHEIDEILSDCHKLARNEKKPPDIWRLFQSL